MKSSKYAIKAALMYLIAMLWANIETDYFLSRDGYHYWPISKGEAICDDIAICIFAVSVFFTIKAIENLLKKL